jgi:hypothetical protein
MMRFMKRKECSKMLDKMYLYGCGAVLVLGLVMPFDASADCVTNANGSVTCGTSDTMGDGSLATGGGNNNNSGNNNNNNNNSGHTWGSNNSGSDKPRWNICINGVSLVDGSKCDDNLFGGQWNKPQKLTATGDEALDVMTNMNPVLGSGYDQKGFFRQIGVYNGRYQPAQGRVFRCTVSPEAYKYTCQSLN